MAIFPVFSIVSHSCLPNASPILLQSHRLALEAKTDIAEGEEITISYVSIMQVN
jgi:SET domain-containing protein